MDNVLAGAVPNTAEATGSGTVPMEELLRRALDTKGSGNQSKSCPTWDGKKPESTLKDWLRDQQFWQKTTNIKKDGWGIALYQALTDEPKKIAETCGDTIIMSAVGYLEIMKKICLHYHAYVEAEVPKCVNTFFYEGERMRGETYTAYCNRKTLAIADLETQLFPETVPERIKSAILMRHSRLDDQERKQLGMTRPGQIAWYDLIKLLSSIDRPEDLKAGLGQTGGKANLYQGGGSASRSAPARDDESQDDGDSDRESVHDPETYYDEEGLQAFYQLEAFEHEGIVIDEAGNPLTTPDGQLLIDPESADGGDSDGTFDEQVASALMIYAQGKHDANKHRQRPNYKQARQALHDAQKNRGFRGRSSGAGKGSSKTRGSSQPRSPKRPQRFVMPGGKLTEEQIRAKTRCFNCDETGHMARECTKPQRPRPSGDRRGSPHPKKSYPVSAQRGVPAGYEGAGPSSHAATQVGIKHEPDTQENTPAPASRETGSSASAGSGVTFLRDPLAVTVPGAPEGAVGKQHNQFVFFTAPQPDADDSVNMPGSSSGSASDGGNRLKLIPMSEADPVESNQEKKAREWAEWPEKQRREKERQKQQQEFIPVHQRPATERMTSPSEERYRNESWAEKTGQPAASNFCTRRNRPSLTKASAKRLADSPRPKASASSSSQDLAPSQPTPPGTRVGEQHLPTEEDKQREEAFAAWERLARADEEDWDTAVCTCGRVFNPNAGEGQIAGGLRIMFCPGCIAGDGIRVPRLPPKPPTEADYQRDAEERRGQQSASGPASQFAFGRRFIGRKRAATAEGRSSSVGDTGKRTRQKWPYLNAAEAERRATALSVLSERPVDSDPYEVAEDAGDNDDQSWGSWQGTSAITGNSQEPILGTPVEGTVMPPSFERVGRFGGPPTLGTERPAQDATTEVAPSTPEHLKIAPKTPEDTEGAPPVSNPSTGVEPVPVQAEANASQGDDQHMHDPSSDRAAPPPTSQLSQDLPEPGAEAKPTGPRQSAPKATSSHLSWVPAKAKPNTASASSKRMFAIILVRGSNSFSKLFPAESRPTFVGLVCAADRGLVDTAAEEGCIGVYSYDDYQKELAKYGLTCRWLSEGSVATESCAGVGGGAKVLGVVEAPIGLGGLNGLMRLTVLQDEAEFRIPLLVPINLQEALGFEISLPREEIRFSCGDARYQTKMVRECTAHRSMSVMEFADGGWQLPAGCLPDCPDGENPFLLRADYTVPQPPPSASSVYILDRATAESPTSQLVPLVRSEDRSEQAVHSSALSSGSGSGSNSDRVGSNLHVVPDLSAVRSALKRSTSKDTSSCRKQVSFADETRDGRTGNDHLLETIRWIQDTNERRPSKSTCSPLQQLRSDPLHEYITEIHNKRMADMMRKHTFGSNRVSQPSGCNSEGSDSHVSAQTGGRDGGGRRWLGDAANPSNVGEAHSTCGTGMVLADHAPDVVCGNTHQGDSPGEMAKRAGQGDSHNNIAVEQDASSGCEEGPQGDREGQEGQHDGQAIDTECTQLPSGKGNMQARARVSPGKGEQEQLLVDMHAVRQPVGTLERSRHGERGDGHGQAGGDDTMRQDGQHGQDREEHCAKGTLGRDRLSERGSSHAPSIQSCGHRMEPRVDERSDARGTEARILQHQQQQSGLIMGKARCREAANSSGGGEPTAISYEDDAKGNGCSESRCTDGPTMGPTMSGTNIENENGNIVRHVPMPVHSSFFCLNQIEDTILKEKIQDKFRNHSNLFFVDTCKLGFRVPDTVLGKPLGTCGSSNSDWLVHGLEEHEALDSSNSLFVYELPDLHELAHDDWLNASPCTAQGILHRHAIPRPVKTLLTQTLGQLASDDDVYDIPDDLMD